MLFFSFKSILAILVPLLSFLNFRISFCISIINNCWEFYWNCVNLERIDSFTMLSSNAWLCYMYGISLHLLKSFFIFHSHFIVSAYRSCKCFIRFNLYLFYLELFDFLFCSLKFFIPAAHCTHDFHVMVLNCKILPNTLTRPKSFSVDSMEFSL